LVYAGTLYGGFRDMSPLFEALSIIDGPVVFDFYGSERLVVEAYQKRYSKISFCVHEAVSKQKIKNIQRQADFLVVALGMSNFEKGVLTGKFFEYVGSRRPIIAICDEDSELALLVRKY